jgi:murein DD-endopeptidase MepM/ murein hydrolase activator NlpD
VAETGAPVMATADGTVSFAGWDTIYGNSVQVDHADQYRTFYGHLLRITRLAGDSVKQGDLIGLVGSTGRSTAPHLHYEVTRAGKQLDPQKYFQ